MEPANALPSLPPAENLRDGQKQVIDLFAQKRDVVAQLPTGYGKTFTGAYCYASLRAQGEANRLLWVVPRCSQENQAAEEIPNDLQNLTGERVSSFSVGYGPAAALGQHRKNKAEVFTVTVQSLMSNQTLEVVQQLMQTGRWMLVVDEHHHYGDDDRSRWSQALRSLPYSARLAMSATPARSDGTSFFPKPDVSVSYIDAYTEGAVKELICHVYDYEIDVVRGSGDEIEVTPYRLSELIREIGSDSPAEIDQYIAARKMRWSPKYISPLIHFPVERMVQNRANGIRSQMLIQAMSCLHAGLVCEQVRHLVPEGMRVDWVGTGPYGKTDDENERVINEFCPAKDRHGRRNWTLDVLVNVGMAGEGLDTTDVTEVVFLNKAGITPTTLQIIGRAARIMRQGQNVPAFINVDSESGLAELTPDKQSHKWIGRNVMAVFDQSEPPKGADGDGENEPYERRDPADLPDEPNVGLIDVRLVDVWKDPVIQEIFDLERDDQRNASKSDEQLAADIERHFLRILAKRDESFNGAAKLSQVREQVDAATSTLAGRAVRQMQAEGARIEKSLVGDLRKRINTRMKRLVGVGVKDADEDQLNQHWRFRKELESELKTKGVPAWLR